MSGHVLLFCDIMVMLLYKRHQMSEDSRLVQKPVSVLQIIFFSLAILFCLTHLYDNVCSASIANLPACKFSDSWAAFVKHAMYIALGHLSRLGSIFVHYQVHFVHYQVHPNPAYGVIYMIWQHHDYWTISLVEQSLDICSEIIPSHFWIMVLFD